MDFPWERETPEILPALKDRIKSRKPRLLPEDATREAPNDTLWEDEEILIEPEELPLPARGDNESFPI